MHHLTLVQHKKVCLIHSETISEEQVIKINKNVKNKMAKDKCSEERNCKELQI